MASNESGGKKSMGFARDIGERVNQSLAVNTSTGDKFFGSSGNPNLVTNSPMLWIAIIAIAAVVGLFIYLRWR